MYTVRLTKAQLDSDQSVCMGAIQRPSHHECPLYICTVRHLWMIALTCSISVQQLDAGSTLLKHMVPITFCHPDQSYLHHIATTFLQTMIACLRDYDAQATYVCQQSVSNQ